MITGFLGMVIDALARDNRQRKHRRMLPFRQHIHENRLPSFAASELACDAMMRAVDFDGERPLHLNNSAFRHQVRAVEMLGLDVFNFDGTPYDATVPGGPMNPEFDPDGYNAAPSIVDFVNSNDLDDVVICYAARFDTGESHTFAADGRTFFDNNTAGAIVDSSGIHPQVSDMKVVKVLRLRPRATGTDSGTIDI